MWRLFPGYVLHTDEDPARENGASQLGAPADEEQEAFFRYEYEFLICSLVLALLGP